MDMKLKVASGQSVNMLLTESAYQVLRAMITGLRTGDTELGKKLSNGMWLVNFNEESLQILNSHRIGDESVSQVILRLASMIRAERVKKSNGHTGVVLH